MKTADQMYQDSLTSINATDVFNESVSQIKEISSYMIDKEINKWTADELSRSLSKLAVLRVNLGEAMVNAMAKYDFSYLHRKLRYASEWKPTKEALNAKLNKVVNADIESKLEQKIAEDREREISDKHMGEQLRILYDSTGTLITALQSRLGVLKRELTETKHY